MQIRRVCNSINVGTNLNSTDADQFITFVGSSSGINPIRVDTDLKYNPSTNRLTAGSFAGDGSALGCRIICNGYDNRLVW